MKKFWYLNPIAKHACRWGSWPENGLTTIGFTPLHQRETDGRTGAVHIPDPASKEEERAPMEVCFAYEDVGSGGSIKDGGDTVCALVT